MFYVIDWSAVFAVGIEVLHEKDYYLRLWLVSCGAWLIFQLSERLIGGCEAV